MGNWVIIKRISDPLKWYNCKCTKYNVNHQNVKRTRTFFNTSRPSKKPTMLPTGGGESPSIRSMSTTSSKGSSVFSCIKRKFRRKEKIEFPQTSSWCSIDNNGDSRHEHHIPAQVSQLAITPVQEIPYVKNDYECKDEIWEAQMAACKSEGEAKLIGMSVIDLVRPKRNTWEQAIGAAEKNSSNDFLTLPVDLLLEIFSHLVPLNQGETRSPPGVDKNRWTFEREKFCFELQSLRLTCRTFFYLIPAWRCEPSREFADRYRRVNRIEYYRFFRQLAARSEMRSHPRLYVCSGCWRVQLSWRGYGFDRGVGGPLCETCNGARKYIWRPPSITLPR